MRLFPQLFVWTIIGQTVLGWDMNGHWAISLIAGNLLQDHTKRFLAETIPTLHSGDIGRSLAYASVWADIVAQTPAFAWSKDLHFANTPFRECGSFVRERDCPNNRCIVTALANYTERASDPSLAQSQREEAVKFILHFMGDIHQPMHVAFAEDAGGSRVQLSRPASNLHYVWDAVVLKFYMEEKELVDATALSRSLKQTSGKPFSSKDMQSLESIGCVFARIASETASQVTCSYGYRHESQEWIEDGDELSVEWFQSRGEVASKQIEKAGRRLASLLDSVASIYFEKRTRSLLASSPKKLLNVSAGPPTKGSPKRTQFELLDEEELGTTKAMILDEQELIRAEKALDETPTREIVRELGKTIRRMTQREVDQVLAPHSQTHGVFLDSIVVKKIDTNLYRVSYKEKPKSGGGFFRESYRFSLWDPPVAIHFDKGILSETNHTQCELAIGAILDRFAADFPPLQDGLLSPIRSISPGPALDIWRAAVKVTALFAGYSDRWTDDAGNFVSPPPLKVLHRGLSVYFLDNVRFVTRRAWISDRTVSRYRVVALEAAIKGAKSNIDILMMIDARIFRAAAGDIGYISAIGRDLCNNLRNHLISESSMQTLNPRLAAAMHQIQDIVLNGYRPPSSVMHLETPAAVNILQVDIVLKDGASVSV
jgi:hypothetical protein